MKVLFKNEAGQVRSGWKIAMALFLMIALEVLFSIAIESGYRMTESGKGLPDSEWAEGPAVDFLYMFSHLVSTWTTITLFLKLEKKSWRELGMTSIRNQKSNLLFGLGLGAFSISLMTALLLASGQVDLTLLAVSPALLGSIFLYFIGFVFVAVNEEWFFRGYVISALQQTKSKWVVYIGSSLIFGFMHLGNSNLDLFGILNVVLVGFLFTFMLFRTNSLWMPIGYHLTWNFFQGNIFGFNVSGTEGTSLFYAKAEASMWTGGAFGLEASVWATVFIGIGFLATHLFTVKKAALSLTHERQPLDTTNAPALPSEEWGLEPHSVKIK